MAHSHVAREDGCTHLMQQVGLHILGTVTRDHCRCHCLVVGAGPGKMAREIVVRGGWRNGLRLRPRFSFPTFSAAHLKGRQATDNDYKSLFTKKGEGCRFRRHPADGFVLARFRTYYASSLMSVEMVGWNGNSGRAVAPSPSVETEFTGAGRGTASGGWGGWRERGRTLLHSLTKARTSSPPPAPGDTAVAPLPGFPKQELQVATILIVVTRVATVMTTASVDVDQPTRDIVVSMSIGSSAGTARAFEGTGIVVEQSSVTASTPNRRNSGHRCAARGRTGPPLEDRSGEPAAGT